VRTYAGDLLPQHLQYAHCHAARLLLVFRSTVVGGTPFRASTVLA